MKVKKKKILIIGKNGFFGKSLKKNLSFHKLKSLGRNDDLKKVNLKILTLSLIVLQTFIMKKKCSIAILF